MGSKPGKKGRKTGRHDRGSHHTPDTAISNKFKRVLQSNGAKAAVAFAELHKRFGLITQPLRDKAKPRGSEGTSGIAA